MAADVAVMADARRVRTEVRQVLHLIQRTPLVRDATQLGVAVVTGAVVLAVLSVMASGIGIWAWIGAGLPVVIEVIKQWRAARRHRRDRRRQVMTAVSPRADLSRQTLAASSLRNRDLTSARLVMTNLSHADLTGATLDDARLRKANLSDANLTDARCRNASFFKARLVEAILDGIDGRGANFRDADLRHASLVGADLVDVDLDGADVRGANFADAILAAGALDTATTDEATVLPDGRPATGSGRPTIVGWRASMVRAARLGVWELARPLAIGAIGLALVAGAMAAPDLSLEVSMLEIMGGDGPTEAPRSDLFERVERPDRVDSANRSRSASSGVASAGASPTSLPADVDQPLVEVPTSAGAAAAVADLPLPDPDLPDPDLPDPDLPSPDQPDLNPTGSEPTLPTTGPSGQLTVSGVLVVVGSEGGPSTAVFRSPIGDASLVVLGQERLDFDGLPVGTTSIEVVPSDATIVATCSILIDGTQRALRQGFPGESIVCEVDLDAEG